MKKVDAEKCLLYGVSLIIVLTVVVRLFFTVSLYDEVFNIHISYLSAVMGQRHLVENTAIFWGDVFNLPFVWIYYQLTGGMDGIVLFMRFVYLGFNIVLSIAFRCIFSSYIGRRNSTLFALVIISYAPFSVYSVWYDSAALFFMLMGEMLLVGAVTDQEKPHRIMLLLSGICHGCMVYAYPLMLGVVLLNLAVMIFRVIKKHDKKEIIQFYILGGIVVVAIFCIYCTCVGWGNIYIFREGAISRALTGRTLQELVPIETTAVQDSVVPGEAMNAVALGGYTAGYMRVFDQLINNVKYIFEKIYQMVLLSIEQQLKSLPITVILLLQWAVGLKRKGKIRFLLLPEIILTAFICHTGTGQWATQTAYAYYACWAPLLYFYIPKEERWKGKVLLLFLWVPALMAYLAVGFTAFYNQKASMGLYTGAICTFIFMCFISREYTLRKKEIAFLVFICIAFVNVALLYLNVYEDDKISQCNYYMKDGVYKGIWTQQDKEKYYNAEMQIKKLKISSGATICLNNEPYYYTSLLLWGEFQQIGGNIQSVEERLSQGENAEEIYYESEWADLMVMNEETYKNCPLAQEVILDKYYDLVVAEGDLMIFKKQ